jgi:hypothetical protein
MRFPIFPASEYFGRTREWMAVELGLFLLLVTFDLEIAERSVRSLADLPFNQGAGYLFNSLLLNLLLVIVERGLLYLK